MSGLVVAAVVVYMFPIQVFVATKIVYKCTKKALNFIIL